MSDTHEEHVGGFRDFDRIEVGDTAELSHRLVDEDVRAFARLTGDHNPLHMDAAYAARTSFRRPVVHGMLSASFISTLIGMLLPGKGALWVSQTLQFRQPAFVGDHLVIRGRVKHKSPATRMLLLTISVTNQKDQEILTGEASVNMPELEEATTMQSSDAPITLITGASRGIGAAIARRLAADGHVVVVNYATHGDEARRVVDDIGAADGRAMAVQADMADAAQVARLFATVEERLGNVSSVVHCASPPNLIASFESLAWESVRRHMDVQLGGALHCAKAALPAMLEARSGCLLFVGSVVTDGPPPPMQTDYVVTKAALTALARSLAVEYGPKGIRVNVIAPGMTATDMITHLPEKAKMLTRMQTPLRRLAESDDIAHVASFLLGPGGRHITGETIRVCGGAVMV